MRLTIFVLEIQKLEGWRLSVSLTFSSNAQRCMCCSVQDHPCISRRADQTCRLVRMSLDGEALCSEGDGELVKEAARHDFRVVEVHDVESASRRRAGLANDPGCVGDAVDDDRSNRR